MHSFINTTWINLTLRLYVEHRDDIIVVRMYGRCDDCHRIWRDRVRFRRNTLHLRGNPFYSGFDFAIQPSTREEYFSSLADLSALSRLSDRQIQEAKELALVFLSYKRVSSNRVPYITDLSGRTITQSDLDQYWIEAADLLTTNPMENDPLYRNMLRMLEEKHQTLLNFEIT